MKLHLLLIAGLCFSMTSPAQKASATFTGFVGDARNNTAVEGAVVHNLTSNELTTTNELGKFVLVKPIGAADSLRISAIAYQTKIATGGASQNILLQPDVVQLKEMTLVAGLGKPLHQISKLDIKMRSLNNAQEILRMVPGLLIGQHAGGGKAEQIFLRGFDIDHGTDVSIAVDGMPVNMVSHAHGQGYADMHFIIPELVEQVQFGKGPYNTAKGNFATAGYVDLQTKERLTQSTLKIEGGQFGTVRALAMLNLLNPATHTGKGLYLASEYLRSRGFFDAPQHFHRLNIFGKYVQALGVKSQLSLSASTFRSKWNASGQIPERAVQSGAISFFGAIDPDEGGLTNRTNVNAQVKTALSGNSYFKNQLYYTAYDFDLYSNFTFFLNDAVNGDQIKQKEIRTLFGYNGSYVHNGFWRGKSTTTEAGLGLRMDRTANSRLAHTKNRTTILENLQLGDVREANASAFVQQTLRWNEKLTLNTGLRFDQFFMQYRNKLAGGKPSANNAIASPKLNITYQVKKAMAFYVSAGRGFHSNDTRVVLQTTSRKALPAAFGIDAGINAKPAANLMLNIALWQLALEQEFVYVGDEGIVEPSGKTMRRGIDVSVRYQPVKKLFIDVDANFADGSFVDEPKGEDYVPLAPRFTTTGGITYKAQTGWNGSLRYRWMANRPANEDNSLTAEGYFIADAVVAYTKPKWEAMLSVQNLLNTRWKETQFETASRLQQEAEGITEIHFTPGTPFFIKAGFSFSF